MFLCGNELVWGDSNVVTWGMSHAVVFSEYNILSSHLVEFLLASKCRVSIVCNGKPLWRERVPHLEENEHLKFLATANELDPNINYVFIVAGIGSNPYGDNYSSETEQQLDSAFTYAANYVPKTVLFLPIFQDTPYQEKVLALSQKAKVKYLVNPTTVYVPELYGTRMSFEEKSPVVQMIKEAVFSSTVSLPEKNFNVYFSYVDDLVREVVEKTFSFGFEKSEFALAQASSVYSFFENLHNLKPSLSILKDENITPPKTVTGVDLLDISQTKPGSLAKTLEWLATYAPAPQSLPKETVKKIEKKVTQKPVVRRKRQFKLTSKGVVLGALVVLFWIFCLPFIALLTSAGLLKLAYHSATQGNFNATQKILFISGKMATFSRSGFAVISATPVVGKKLIFARETASVLALTTQAAGHGIEVAQTGTVLVAGILGDKDYDLTGLSRKMASDLGSLQKEMDFLSQELNNLPVVVKSALPKDLDPTKLSQEVGAARSLFTRLPVLLGSPKSSTYLVLFQNNMELRPAGGFIGSFALVSFEKGKLINLEVNDVYSADGQLKGHIEPPTPIRDYLGEANWYLRDSNWDPNFPESATRAEWFLGKEMERPVDGVVGIDLELAKKMLAVTGPITLTDFNQTINSQNMYEKVQYEVESEFFPGSRKKANFLTSLSRELLGRLTHAQKKDYLALGKVLYESLGERHLQIFLHDAPTAQALAKVNWDGGVALPVCQTKNCLALPVGEVEANVGVNKSNYFINREIGYDLAFIGNQLVVKQTINLVNTANPALGLAGKYKVYVRSLAPEKSVFQTVEVSDVQGTKYEDPEVVHLGGRAEAGILVDVSPSTKKKVVFTYQVPNSLSFTTSGEILFLTRKQAGTGEDGLTLKVKFPRVVKVETGGSLTQTALAQYNTSLRGDIKTRFSW